MNIVFGCDKGYLPHLAVAIRSLIVHHDTPLTIYLLHTEIDDADWANLVSLDTEKKHQFVNCKVNAAELNKLATKGQFTTAMYYRLLIEDLLPCDKALYIDSDVVINQNLRALWHMPLGDYHIAAVEEPTFSGEYLGMQVGAKYFNSGVMLMNLKHWREDAISKQVIEYIREKDKSLVWPDQCALNAVINGRWLALNPSYNMQTNIFVMDAAARQKRYPFADLDEALRNPAIVHFTGYSKPWHLLNEHPFKKLYWHYLRQTPYKRLFATDISVKKLGLWCLPKAIRTYLQKKLKT